MVAVSLKKMLQRAIAERLPGGLIRGQLVLAPSHGAVRAALYRQQAVRSEQLQDEALGTLLLEVELPEPDLQRILHGSGLNLTDLMPL